MSDTESQTPFLYVDDGFPESREYANNYLPLPAEPARNWLRDLLARLSGRRSRRRAAPCMMRRWTGRRSTFCGASIQTSH